MNQLYTLLTRLQLIPVPPRPYSTDILRYELRMKPFLNIGLPELVPFEQFENLVTIPDDSNLEVLQCATVAIGRARRDYELLGKMDAKTSRSLLCEEEWGKVYISSCIHVLSNQYRSMVFVLLCGSG